MRGTRAPGACHEVAGSRVQMWRVAGCAPALRHPRPVRQGQLCNPFLPVSYSPTSTHARTRARTSGRRRTRCRASARPGGTASAAPSPARAAPGGTGTAPAPARSAPGGVGWGWVQEGARWGKCLCTKGRAAERPGAASLHEMALDRRSMADTTPRGRRRLPPCARPGATRLRDDGQRGARAAAAAAVCHQRGGVAGRPHQVKVEEPRLRHRPVLQGVWVL